MTTFANFRTQLITAAIAAVITLSGYIWNGHVSAEAAQSQAIQQELKQLRDIVIRLDAYIAHQQELNEWFVTEHQRRNLSPNR